MQGHQEQTLFQSRFFAPVKALLAQASQPGNSLRNVSDLLEPFAVARSLAEGADRVCTDFRGTMSRTTFGTIEGYMETTTAEAKALLPLWQRIHDKLSQIGSTTLFRRLTSTEADIGADVGSWLSTPGAGSRYAAIIGRLLGATAGIAIEQARLGVDVASIDRQYSDWFYSIRSRFHQRVIPAFLADVGGAR